MHGFIVRWISQQRSNILMERFFSMPWVDKCMAALSAYVTTCFLQGLLVNVTIYYGHPLLHCILLAWTTLLIHLHCMLVVCTVVMTSSLKLLVRYIPSSPVWECVRWDMDHPRISVLIVVVALCVQCSQIQGMLYGIYYSLSSYSHKMTASLSCRLSVASFPVLHRSYRPCNTNNALFVLQATKGLGTRLGYLVEMWNLPSHIQQAKNVLVCICYNGWCQLPA